MSSTQIIDLLPQRPLTNVDIEQCAEKLKLPNFRGVFMRNLLPIRILENECGVVNLDNSHGRGTHWVSYIKRGFFVLYFDSFGNLRPPLELLHYFNSGPYSVKVKYNYFTEQRENSFNCGHLCLKFLASQS